MDDIRDTMGKKIKQSIVGGLKYKEIEDALQIGGFIATTHLDSGFEEDGTYFRDRVDKDTLDRWADELNNGIPRANKVSIRHDRDDPVVAGAAITGSAKVMELPDGEFGLYVDSVLDSTHDQFDVTKHRLDIGTYDGFSIEFTADQFDTIEKEGYTERVLLPDCTLHGYAIASRPMNEYAVRIKEVLKENLNFKEENTMTDKEVKEDTPEEPVKEEEESTEKEEQAEEEKKETKEEFKVDDKEYEEFRKFKEMQSQKAAEEEKESLKKDIVSELKEAMKSVDIQDKTMKPKAEDKEMEVKEVKEWQEASVDKEISVQQIARKAAALSDKLGLTMGRVATTKQVQSKVGQYHKNFTTNGVMLECKGLGMTTNQNSDTDYLQSAAELSDVYDPVIYNVLNQATVTWNVLQKEDYSMKGNNQVQFTLKTAANTSAAFYTGNAILTGNVTRQKYQTKFKKVSVGVSVDGDMIAAARGGPVGDVFAQEVIDSTEDMLAVVNAALYAEVGAETAAGPIGFEYITDQSGNGTLYNVTRSQANGLSSTTTADNYINGSSQDITLANLRAAKRKALKEGSLIQDLVFFTDHIQGDKLRGIYDAAQRLVPTSSRVGFENMMEFDGIPVFEDKDCNDDDVFLIDLSIHKVAIWVPPTLEMLGKDSDAEKGFIKMYMATFNRAPRRCVQIYGNATS